MGIFKVCPRGGDEVRHALFILCELAKLPKRITNCKHLGYCAHTLSSSALMVLFLDTQKETEVAQEEKWYRY